MHPLRNSSIAATCAILIAFLHPGIAAGCTIVYPTVHVGRAFGVKVTDRGRPVAALRLVLRPFPSGSPDSGDRGVSYSLTDAEGYARFTDLAPGSYFLSPEHDGEMGDGSFVDVTPNGAIDLTVRLRWPEATPLLVRSLSGTLRTPDYYPQQAQAQFSISLLESLSGRVIEKTHSDSKGRFTFNDPVKPGLYFLELSDLSGTRTEGTITVEVNHDAQEAGLDIDLGWTSCGLHYGQRRNYPEMREKNLCGNVADVLGAVIPDAKVWLLSNGDDAQILERTQTDGTGQFALHEQRDGTYQLLVKRAGFQPFIRVVLLETAERSSSCRQPISVRLEAE
jgi:Carboxypeptidase regulatory-like domain